MKCIRCELTRAKLLAGALNLLGRSTRSIVDALNVKYDGSYYKVWNDKGEMIYRASNVKGGPPIEILFIGPIDSGF